MGPIQNNQIDQLLATRIQSTTPNVSRGSKVDGFESILDSRLKVSGHAATRLKSRNIDFGPEEYDRVASGIDRAAAKGAKESLVLMDDVALVVSVKNRTVITAVDKSNLKENVFTNIDSAVIV